MNKTILLIALIGAAFAADAAAPACSAASVKNEYLGTCKYQNPLCKTYTDGACSACTGSTGTTAPACTCGTGNTLTSTDAGGASPDCKARATANAWCPDGYGLFTVSDDSDKKECKVCDAKCKACNQAANAAAWDGTKCSACYDSGAAIAGTTCAAGTKNKHILQYVGWFEKCPAGYAANAAGDACVECGKSCELCAHGTPDTCTGCADGHIIKNNLCVVVDATNACDATCKTCKTTATNCLTCADGHKMTAEGKCEKPADVFGCKTLVEGKTDECKECDTDFVADGKVCKCKDAQKYIKTTDYKAASGTDAAVYYKQECAACTETCKDGKVCKKDGTGCEDAPAPKVACDDATLKDAGCNTCAKATEGDMKDKFVCSACSADQTAATTGAKGCSCNSKTHAWDKTNRKCVKCAAECTTAAPSCNLGTDGKATCGAAPTTTTGTDDGSNGILISAISMILAVILA